ncbi:phosphatase PAP2 family protein [Paraburkholderia aromaticivorans]|uniref:phosphatase PAP2 family protein n=1 Tax=Paraburkholderia aromaticivorans TaxID=2026199 RepID=UPI001455F446|nr:phosphatase PAP2 family protein [Paraburkholderia aromaticivorans]
MPQYKNIGVRFVQPRPSMMTRYLCGWLIAGGIILVDAIWLCVADYTVQMDGIVAACKGVGILACIAVILRILRAIPRYGSTTVKFRYAETSDIAAWCALLVCFVSSMCVLSYLCVSVNAPLVERNLVRFDLAVGFDWVAAYQWVQTHPHVLRVLALAYDSGRWQLLTIPFILGLSGRREALSDFFFLLALASILLLVSSTPFPAASAFVYFNIGDPNVVATVSDFAPLRNGTLRAIDLANSQGLVSMPSFHAALAVLFTYSLRRMPWFFGFAAALNLTMIISTPTQGGHYLADVVGGLLLAALTIQMLRTGYRRRTASASAVAAIERVLPH